MRTFKFESKNSKDLDSLIIGFFRSETGNLLGLEPNTKAYDDACESASEPIEKQFVPLLGTQTLLKARNLLQDSVSSDRIKEAFGAYLILLFTRFSVIRKAIIDGKVKQEDASPETLARVLYEQLNSFIQQVR